MHIEIVESQAVLLGIWWFARRKRHAWRRITAVTDSQVSFYVLFRGRSRAPTQWRLRRRTCALCLALFQRPTQIGSQAVKTQQMRRHVYFNLVPHSLKLRSAKIRYKHLAGFCFLQRKQTTFEIPEQSDRILLSYIYYSSDNLGRDDQGRLTKVPCVFKFYTTKKECYVPLLHRPMIEWARLSPSQQKLQSHGTLQWALPTTRREWVVSTRAKQFYLHLIFTYRQRNSYRKLGKKLSSKRHPSSVCMYYYPSQRQQRTRH